MFSRQISRLVKVGHIPVVFGSIATVLFTKTCSLVRLLLLAQPQHFPSGNFPELWKITIYNEMSHEKWWIFP